MEDYRLIYPMFAMVVLTFSVVIRLFRARSKFVAEGTVDVSYFKTYQDGNEPEASAKLARHFSNLYEAPVLFYVCCLAGTQNKLQSQFAARYTNSTHIVNSTIQLEKYA